jgi:DNA-binding transcriptional LysR family regulator
MRLEQLRYFVAVAEHRHFTQAAAAVGVAQPSLSKQIHALEAELGASLFTRGDVALTPAGEALLPRARSILADVDTARREVHDLIGLRRGRVRLGATPSLCTSLLPRVLRDFHDEHPGVELYVTQGGSHDLVRDLGRGDLDLALIVLPAEGTEAGLLAEPILREPLVVASGEPIAGPLRVTDLRDRPLVMFRAGYNLRDDALAAFRQAGIVPRYAVEGGELDAVLGFVEAGLGVALVPEMVLADRPRLHAARLVAPGIQRTIALARRRGVGLTHAARALHERIRSAAN